MPGRWEHSNRKASLPRDWAERRFKVRLRAGGRCEVVEDGARCPSPGAECDHVIPGNLHDLSNLQWICKPHHAAKSSREGNAAPRVTSRRPPERHPAL